MNEKGKKSLVSEILTVDDLFTTQEQRDDKKREKVMDIDLSMIDDFPNHPFKVLENEDFRKLSESISESGVLVPTLVRPKPDGRYEMVSGHRRKKASEYAGRETLPCIVRELTDDEATIIMVDSNLHREKILPSEKAYAYKMKLEALKHQGSRSDLTSGQVGHKLKSRDIVAEGTEDSARQVQRYIRLTNLVPELLDMVDNDALDEKPSIAFNPAVELSFLTEEQQYMLYECIDYLDATPSLSQAQRMKKLSEEGRLDDGMIEDILGEEKANQVPKIRFNESRIRKVLPKSIDNEHIEDFVIKSIEYYSKYLKQRENGAR